MFRNILVPVDLSDKARIAVDAARDLARADGTSVHLLHVIETIRGVDFEEAREFYEGLEKRAEQAIERWVRELPGSLQIERQISFGRRAQEIVRYAEESACDLIVLASHPLDPERPGGGLGTLSHQVALGARCPVLLMR